VYSFVPREQIAETLIHLRGLFRESPLSNEKGHRAQERREILTKNLLSNLFRTKDHPTLHAVLEVPDAFSLTLDGAHRLFGYELERIREYDLKLNAGRTQNLGLRLRGQGRQCARQNLQRRYQERRCVPAIAAQGAFW